MAALLQMGPEMQTPLWIVVLAAGAGTRLASVTGGVPKQFWSIDGGPSLVEQTVERLQSLSVPERTLTVIKRGHERYVNTTARGVSLGRLVAQPCDRGTATGIGLALATVLESASDAIVLVTPSDHGVARPRMFRKGVGEGVAAVRAGRSGIVLFGVEPDAAQGDYGWIAPRRVGATSPDRIQDVAAFVEKPGPLEAARLLNAGAIWNTMVLAARASTLFDLYRQFLPELAEALSTLLRLPADRRDAYITELYARLPSADFSADLLSRSRGLAVYTWPASIGWSDLGTPRRLASWLRSNSASVGLPFSTDPLGSRVA
jgi:mannose-1-phosphate guanylyltransferase